MIKDVQRVLRAKKRPLVTIFPSMVSAVPTRPAGRPRVRPDGTSRLHLHPGRRGRSWPRCLAKGCRTYLKRSQAGFCSETCADQAVNDALDALRRARMTEEALLKLWRQGEEKSLYTPRAGK